MWIQFILTHSYSYLVCVIILILNTLINIYVQLKLTVNKSKRLRNDMKEIKFMYFLKLWQQNLLLQNKEFVAYYYLDILHSKIFS